MSSFHQINVAVVDDDESVRRSFSRLLRAAGMQAVTYPSAEHFLADTKQPRFDCLLLDIELGGMSGIELHRQLTASGLTIPVIYRTANDEPSIREAARAAGCTAYFSKTESGKAVIQAIRRTANLKEVQK